MLAIYSVATLNASTYYPQTTLFLAAYMRRLYIASESHDQDDISVATVFLSLSAPISLR